MNKPLLSIRNVEKSFGSVKAVDDVSLDIQENEFFALLGPSGSGKTTLLRMIAGFEDLTSGAMLLDDKDIAGVPANRRPVNLMFQSYALFPHMSVAQNIAYGLEMENLEKPEISTRVDEILDVIQLSHVAKRKPDQLSGGQRQRVALARALVKRPRILLLDEPLGALDKKLRSEMQLELKNIQDEFGITFIVVTHDQEEALVMADRIAILKDGKLKQCGSPRDIYEHPDTRFAAEFIGVMNFLPVIPSGEDFVDATGATIKAAQKGDIKAGESLVAAVRPERLSVQPEKSENSLSGKISAVAYHGLDMQLHIESPVSETPVIIRVSADAADGADLSIGNQITVGWSARDTRILNA